MIARFEMKKKKKETAYAVYEEREVREIRATKILACTDDDNDKWEIEREGR